ncbi:MAG: TolC family protein [Muribaculaceae bacterium]|nr:TolC family protein [Muribaculaceae bacterium]
MMKKTNILAVVALSLAMGGCGIYKKYELPTDNAVINDYRTALSETPDSTSLPYLGWRQVFTDPQLQTLIQTAIDNNKDLYNAALNVDIAAAQLKGAKLSYFPAVSFAPNGAGASYGGANMNWSYTIPVSVSWEVDIFGKILNRKRGAQMSLEQARDSRDMAQSRLVCGVASTYYALVMLNQQLALTQRTSEIWKEQVESMKLMKDAGMVTEAAVVQSEANYYNILSTIPDLEESIHSTQNALSLLLNTYPQKWQVTSDLDFSLPDSLIEGLPVTYLAARPDVRAAERGFAAAYYATNQARANFYPNLVISSQGGFTNLMGAIVNPGKWFIQLAGQLTAPIFSRGQNIATLEAAKASQQIALNNFQYSILNAAGEVSDALIKYKKNHEKRLQVEKQVEALEKSVEYTEELLSFGQSTTYLEVLTARSGLLQAQLTSLACWHNKVTAIIELYQAAGGGR